MSGIAKKKKEKVQPTKKPEIKGKKGGQDKNSKEAVTVFKNPNSTLMEREEALKKLENNICAFLEAEELELIATESTDPEKRKEAVIKLFLDGHNEILKKITESNCLYENTKEYALELINRRTER